MRRDDNIDFHDVFGGPPSRASMQDMQFSDCDYDETNKWPSSCSRPRDNEKPVFGEVHRNRRRYTTDCFFNDIFQGGRKHQDCPSSRGYSPVRNLPRDVEPFAPSSLPAGFSLPDNLSEEVNLPASGAAAHSTYHTTTSASVRTQHSSTPDVSPPRLSSEAISGQEELLYDVRIYRPSPLSRDISINSEASSNSINSDISDKGYKSEKDLLENQKKSSQFHFSIYKWAGKGVPSLISVRAGRNSRLKEKTKYERSPSFRSSITSKSLTENLHNPSPSSITDNLDEENNSSGMNCGKRENEMLKNQEPDLLISGTENMNKTLGSDKDAPKNYTSQNPGRKEGFPSSSEKLAAKKSDQESSVETHKSEATSLPILFYNEEYERGNVDAASQSNRWTSGTSKKEKEKEGSAEATKTNDKIQIPDVNAEKISTDPSIKAYEYLKESENQQSASETNDYVPNNISAGQKDNSASNTAPIPNGPKATEGLSEKHFSQNFQVYDVLQAEDELLKRDNNQEETQAIDTKIRKWSNGKEGNIRSLLSTLQYVLCPGSGWKPVPLVDIIEGNAVKKAYQKAMLCLHPDKLQQKGASSHQKYTAEKVFDILQEAWDHFNSLNPL